MMSWDPAAGQWIGTGLAVSAQLLVWVLRLRQGFGDHAVGAVMVEVIPLLPPGGRVEVVRPDGLLVRVDLPAGR
jgi:hypothetical protein